jgi:hypothetical protein
VDVDVVRPVVRGRTSGCSAIGSGRDPHSHNEPDELPRVGGNVREDDIERIAKQHDKSDAKHKVQLSPWDVAECRHVPERKQLEAESELSAPAPPFA